MPQVSPVWTHSHWEEGCFAGDTAMQSRVPIASLPGATSIGKSTLSTFAMFYEASKGSGILLTGLRLQKSKDQGSRSSERYYTGIVPSVVGGFISSRVKIGKLLCVARP